MMPRLPKLLQPEELKKLNDFIFCKTQCFAFLQPDQVVLATHPASWQDAFTITVVGLYGVYHDMGCKFLNLLLSPELCPPTMPVEKKHINHIIRVNTKFRVNLTHGILLVSDREKFLRILSRYTGKPNAGESFADYVNSLTDNHWEEAGTRLLQEADNLYSYLVRWIEEWEKHPEALLDLPTRFCSSTDFENSIDYRVCSPLITSVSNIRGRDIQVACDANLDSWRRQVVSTYQKNPMCPDEYYRYLTKIISTTLNPRSGMESSSTSIAASHGFAIPSPI